MNTTEAQVSISPVRLDAEADQHNAAVIRHSGSCDPFELCANCEGHKASAVARRHLARVERVRRMMGQ